MLELILDKIKGKTPKGKRRHKDWPKVRDRFIAIHKRCALCKGKKRLEVHHIIPFHIMPELELMSDNLVVLCEDKRYGLNCHLAVGHLGNYRRFNVNCLQDVVYWRSRLFRKFSSEKASTHLPDGKGD